jgi:hypothetical protein
MTGEVNLDAELDFYGVAELALKRQSVFTHEKGGSAEYVPVHESVTTNKDGLFCKKHLLHEPDSVKPRSRKEVPKGKKKGYQEVG